MIKRSIGGFNSKKVLQELEKSFGKGYWYAWNSFKNSEKWAHNVFLSAIKENKTVVCAETPIIGREMFNSTHPNSYFRVGINNVSSFDPVSYNIKDMMYDNKRLEKILKNTNTNIKPWRKNGEHILYALQLPADASLVGLDVGDPLYSALKAAVTHFTKMSGVELGEDNIRVNAISPGAIATPIFWGGSGISNTLTDEENEKKLTKLQGNLANAVPLGRSGLALDIAEAALYLASDSGSFVTCQDIS